MDGRLVIVDGPVASGKSTVKAIIKEVLNGRAWAITQSPFALITYLITKLVTTLTLNKQCRGSYPLTCLEIRKPQVLTRLLNVLMFLDLVQSIAIAAAAKALGMVGINVVIEDYTPTIILDHTLYKRLYANTQNTSRLIMTLYKINLATLLALRSIGIYVYTDGEARVRRSLVRGYRVARPEILHDSAKGSALVKAMKLMLDEVYVINNNGSLIETKRQVIDVLAGLNDQ